MEQPRSRRAAVLEALAAAAALALVASTVRADHHEGTTPSKPLVVKIHADWCGTCTKLDTTWKQLEAEHGDSVQFVVLDVTDRDATESARREAERLGITGFYDQYKAKTGTVAVVNGSTRKTVRVMYGELDASKYRPAIEAARGT